MHSVRPPVRLVCEDEALIALDLESCLADAGLMVAGPFKASAEALDWIGQGHAPDLALLNFRLVDGSCVALIQALRGRGVPIVVQSGLQPDATDMPQEILGLPWLSKPFSYGDLLNTVWGAIPSLPLDRRRRFQFIEPLPHRTQLEAVQITRGRRLTHVLTRRLGALCPLSEVERQKLEDAVSQSFEVDGGRDISRAGEQITDCHVLLGGMAAPYRLLSDGRRQITRFCFPGDLIDLDGFVGGKMDHNVVAIGPCTIGRLSHQVLRELSREHPAIGLAFWRHTLADTAVFREWVVNVGRRSASERIAHLLCEVFVRFRDAELAQDDGGTRSFSWPVTQSLLADAVGTSTVHVNRSIQELRGRGLIQMSRDTVTILDWAGLKTMSGFEPDYLHPVLMGADQSRDNHVRAAG